MKWEDCSLFEILNVWILKSVGQSVELQILDSFFLLFLNM